MHEFMQWAVLVALACGATFAVWILDACLVISGVIARKLLPNRATDVVLGVAVFLAVMLGAPALIVLWGFASGRLPISQ